jgi:hypothetical protein
LTRVIPRKYSLITKRLRKVSIDVIFGLESILESFATVDPSQNDATNKVRKPNKKRKLVKKNKAPKSRTNLPKTRWKLNIANDRLVSIVNSLALI